MNMNNTNNSNNSSSSNPIASIIIPEPFLGIDGGSWNVTGRDGSSSQLGFLGVLMHTLRQSVPIGHLDNQKSLQAFRIIRSTQEQNDQVLDMNVGLFYWMVNYFQYGGNRVWKAPDLAFLIEILDQSVTFRMEQGLPPTTPPPATPNIVGR